MMPSNNSVQFLVATLDGADARPTMTEAQLDSRPIPRFPAPDDSAAAVPFGWAMPRSLRLWLERRRAARHLARSAARLAALSPHLLDDLGLAQPAGMAPLSAQPPAPRPKPLPVPAARQ